jgi:hypothetical protein
MPRVMQMEDSAFALANTENSQMNGEAKTTNSCTMCKAALRAKRSNPVFPQVLGLLRRSRSSQ